MMVMIILYSINNKNDDDDEKVMIILYSIDNKIDDDEKDIERFSSSFFCVQYPPFIMICFQYLWVLQQCNAPGIVNNCQTSGPLWGARGQLRY